MKKIIIPALIIILLFSFVSCAKTDNKTIKNESTSASTTKESTQTTTELPTVPSVKSAYELTGKADEEQGNELIKTVTSQIDTNDNSVTVSGRTEVGYFVLNYARSAASIYSQEKDEEYEAIAKRIATDFANSIEKYYGSLKLVDTKYQIISSSGENGIESVRYYYYFEPNKKSKYDEVLTIIVDSDGVISYVNSSLVFASLK